MRFDDSLKTVLAGDISNDAGARSAWRQLIDLMSRGRIASDEPTLARLRMLRQAVPTDVRAATGRALAFATPGAALVGFFAEDSLAIAAPVLRTAVLPAADWIAILPRLGPEARSILRHRRDLPGEVTRALESFGATDFVLEHDRSAATAAAEPGMTEPATVVSPSALSANDMIAVIGPAAPPVDAPRSASPFVALGAVARGLPVVAEALRQADAPGAAHATPTDAERSEIADLVARIDAFNRRREAAPPVLPIVPPSAPVAAFRYETDAAGVVTAVDGVARTALVGVSFAYAAQQGVVGVDAVMSGALRRRGRFADARLDVGGRSDAAGSWRVSGEPRFDAATGRFIGFAGTARRPRPDETAGKGTGENRGISDSLRQLVHELRTPTNAIAGFAELIESQLLGPVAPSYLAHATTIRDEAAALIAVIDDLDTAARIEGKALDLRPSPVPLAPIFRRVAADLAPLATLRQATVAFVEPGMLGVQADDRALERLLSRLLATLVSAATPGERIAVAVADTASAMVAITFTRPRSIAAIADTALLSIDADTDAPDGTPLLGIGFTLRLARNLAAELGGALVIEADRLTLRLPAALDHEVEQAIN